MYLFSYSDGSSTYTVTIHSIYYNNLYHHHQQLQGLGLLACSDLPVRRTDPSRPLSLLPLGI
jgi:hypothetical protein